MIVAGDGSLAAEDDKYVTAEVFLRLLKQKVRIVKVKYFN
jgi:hypothetical protein